MQGHRLHIPVVLLTSWFGKQQHFSQIMFQEGTNVNAKGSVATRHPVDRYGIGRRIGHGAAS